jgi:hypothetical protein
MGCCAAPRDTDLRNRDTDLRERKRESNDVMFLSLGFQGCVCSGYVLVLS